MTSNAFRDSVSHITQACLVNGSVMQDETQNGSQGLSESSQTGFYLSTATSNDK